MSITLYSTNCPKCIVLGKKMEMKGLTYKLCTDVDLMMSKGFLQAPMLEVDGSTMDFVSAVQWVNNL